MLETYEPFFIQDKIYDIMENLGTKLSTYFYVDLQKNKKSLQKSTETKNL